MGHPVERPRTRRPRVRRTQFRRPRVRLRDIIERSQTRHTRNRNPISGRTRNRTGIQ